MVVKTFKLIAGGVEFNTQKTWVYILKSYIVEKKKILSKGH